MTWRTLKQWNKKGRKVIAGEHSRLRDPDTGEALFCKKQAEKVKVVYRDPEGWDDIDDDDGFDEDGHFPSFVYEDYDEQDYELDDAFRKF